MGSQKLQRCHKTRPRRKDRDMAAELRFVVFSKPEFLAAVRDYRASTGRPLPNGPTRRLQLEMEAGLTATLEILDERDDRVHEIIVETDFIASALILYCKRHGIPLPLHARKSVELVGSNVSLVISKNMTELGPALSKDDGPAVMRADH
jgi:hypothetical protein